MLEVVNSAINEVIQLKITLNADRIAANKELIAGEPNMN